MVAAAGSDRVSRSKTVSGRTAGAPGAGPPRPAEASNTIFPRSPTTSWTPGSTPDPVRSWIERRVGSKASGESPIEGASAGSSAISSFGTSIPAPAPA